MQLTLASVSASHNLKKQIKIRLDTNIFVLNCGVTARGPLPRKGVEAA